MGAVKFAEEVFAGTKQMIAASEKRTREAMRAEFATFLAGAIAFDGERTLMIGDREFKLAVPLYRGIHQAANTYQRGDLVTVDGSLWHCHAASTRERPGKGVDWQLAVKKGAAG